MEMTPTMFLDHAGTENAPLPALAGGATFAVAYDILPAGNVSSWRKISSKRVHSPPKSDIIMIMTVKAIPCHEGTGGSLLRGAMAWVL